METINVEITRNNIPKLLDQRKEDKLCSIRTTPKMPLPRPRMRIKRGQNTNNSLIINGELGLRWAHLKLNIGNSHCTEWNFFFQYKLLMKRNNIQFGELEKVTNFKCI